VSEVNVISVIRAAFPIWASDEIHTDISGFCKHPAVEVWSRQTISQRHWINGPKSGHWSMSAAGRVRVAMNDCFADVEFASGRSERRPGLEDPNRQLWGEAVWKRFE
jgi:hypothetical protein